MLLRDKTVLLAASPAPPAAENDAWELASNVEEATLSLARAIIAEGGRIVMPWDDALSPLVAQVAIEQQRPRQTEERVPEDPREREPRLVAFRLAGSEAGPWDAAFARLGAGRIREISPDSAERPARRRRRPPVGASLRAMHEAIIREHTPCALIGVGGGDLGEMIELFAVRQPPAPIYVLSTTGAEGPLGRDVRLFDREILDLHARIFAELADSYGWERPEDEDAERIVPYPLVAQMLVEEIAERNGRENRRVR